MFYTQYIAMILSSSFKKLSKLLLPTNPFLSNQEAFDFKLNWGGGDQRGITSQFVRNTYFKIS